LVNPHLNNIGDNFIHAQVVRGIQDDETDLNEVVQTVCNRYLVEEQKNFILRFDQLPIVQGKNRDCFVQLFDPLIAMIVCHPPLNSKLFLYIKCSQEKSAEDVIDRRISGNLKLYRIEFHTNITTNESWEALYKNKLEECSLLANQSGGSFSFSPICNTGCLFSVCLPGKIN
jgi:hypothetical protein